MDDTDLRPFTGYLLRRAYAKAVGTVQACLPDDAHVRHVTLLGLLDTHGAMSQRELSAATGVNRSTMVKLVDGLEGHHWVVRERNPADRRSYALRLTPAGAAALRALQQELERADAQLTAKLTDRQVQRLRQLLTELLGGTLSDQRPLAPHPIGYLVARAHRKLRVEAERVLSPLGLHPRDFGVLSLLAREQPCSQSHLAQHLGVSAPAVLGFVDDLVGSGLVCRSRNRDDRRSYDLSMAGPGFERLAAARQAAADLQAEVVRRIGAAGDRELRQLLEKLLD